MVLSGDEDVEQSFTNLCLDLNMDRNAKEEAWESYRRIRTHYVLEVRCFFLFETFKKQKQKKKNFIFCNVVCL